MKKVSGLAFLVRTCLSTSTLGQTSQQYALTGHKVWIAFECSALADITGNATESQRLFDVGYKAGKTFVEAVQDGKVNTQDINKEVPVGVIILLHGPTVDFILGRIYEAAGDNATKDVLPDDKNLKKVAAQSKYNRMNCSLM
jgi:hypothetical protein